MQWRAGLIAMVLAGCSTPTPYQEMGSAGGVHTQQVTADTYRIIARGNAVTSGTKIQDYTLLKAAETTKDAGGTHFMIISEADASQTGYVQTASTAHTTVVGNTAYTTFNPGSVHAYVKPGQDTYIRIFTAAANQSPPRGAVSADEIIQFVGDRVKGRWAAIVPNHENSTTVVWAKTQDQANRLAIDACKRVSGTCASKPASTNVMATYFAVMCCTRPDEGCAVGVSGTKREALKAVKSTFSDAGFSNCSLKSYIKAGTGEKS